MAKTIIITLILFFTIIFNPIQAQDASNDATWEETIDFIKKNKGYMEAISSVGHYSNVGVSINDYDRIITKNENRYYIEKNTGDLNKIQSVSSVMGSSIGIYFVGRYVKYGLYHKNSESSPDNQRHHGYIEVRVHDSEMYPRLVKAFEHLAYLATKKRKKGRQASGEKF